MQSWSWPSPIIPSWSTSKYDKARSSGHSVCVMCHAGLSGDEAENESRQTADWKTTHTLMRISVENEMVF